MISFETYQKIQDLYEIGLSKSRIAKKLGVTERTVSRWVTADETEFYEMKNTRFFYLDQYKEFMLEQIRAFPQIKTTNLYYKTQDAFADFDCPRSAFYRYVMQLKRDYGFEKFTGRQTQPREDTPPGYEAQVDFGQSKMLDMYGRQIRVYFFCMVLSYSRMHFVYFSAEPFNTGTAIKAHECAFRYFGGRTQTIMYDQDRVFVVSENLGNIIFVEQFEDFVKEIGYSVVLCRPRDPQTKGKVESFVKYVKENFLVGTVFTGIDSLNSAALRWLDVEANGTRNYDTRFIPRDMFLEEIPHLQKVHYRSGYQNNFRSVSAKFDITWDGSRYQLDKSLVNIKDTLRIEEENGALLMYRVSDEKLVHHCQKAEHPGEKINTVPSVADRAVSLTSVKRMFSNSKAVCQYVEGIDKHCTRYKTAHYKWILKLAKCCALDELEEAMEHCIAVEQFNSHELIAFLIYRHGEARLKKSLGNYMFYHCKQRAKELEQEATACQPSEK